MRASVEPLSQVAPELWRAFLGQYGFSREIVDWKYFDDAFGDGRERAYVWLKDDRVQGGIGIIPFSANAGSGSNDCGWTCDWFVDESMRNPGVGVLIIKAAMEAEGQLFTVGGNELTARIVPRMAEQVIPDAALELSLPLTIGGTGLFAKVERRVGERRMEMFGRVPLPVSRSAGSISATVRTTAGVDRVIDALAHEGRGPEWSPAYGWSHVDWLVGRCPVVESLTSFAPGAAAVYWRARPDGRHWRVACWIGDQGEETAGAVIAEATQQIRRLGGRVITAIVAERDQRERRVLEDAGFRPTGTRLPFYALITRTPGDAVSPAGLNHLASDLAYRF